MESISVVDAKALLPGDIILSTGANKVSWFIRAATLGSYSHAALHVGSGIAVEANDPGVIPVFLPAVSYEANTKIRVLRAGALSVRQQEELTDFVWSLLFRPYSTKGAIGTILPFLRDQTDAGYFCSQLTAAAYKSIDAPITDRRPEECTPNDLAASPLLDEVTDAVRTVPMETHKAVASLLGASYQQYVESGNRYENGILKVCKNKLPPKFSQPFNLYDLARQLFDGSVDRETSQIWDVAVGALIKNVISEFPLAPCPGISVATSLLNADRWMVALFTPEWATLVEDEVGRAYYHDFIASLTIASNWEVTRWLADHERMLAEAKKRDSRVLEALGMWIGHAAAIRYQYAALMRNSTNPGFLSRDEVEAIKKRLKGFQDRQQAAESQQSATPQ
ncbi:C40 family peptidase [Rhizobium leguminosarum]|uniref:hypothetical protein n=1 Tax=Rhizobium leguminosarum TaxID=384 RepID=UPI001038741E|nr:hypothetical protein [Rhizobium leguminosarum]MBY5461842.1 hypothetical protein [Rhizobium leguminosarum]TCA42871.1 hypothetical protein E0H72_15685 [Rhizobium leguminosarum bv. viciae]